MKYFLLLSILVIGTPAQDVPSYAVDELIGIVEPSENKAFDKLRNKYTTKESAYLRNEVYDAFKDMWKDAKRDDIDLVIISATRNKEYQSGIWNRKWNSFGGDESTRAERILQYSSMPGSSRHHWGTDFDLNALENSYFERGAGVKIYKWLQENAHKYGFFQPYTGFNAFRDAGYREEKWHWSYYPTASKILRAYNHHISYKELGGFNGDAYAEQLDVINNYVNGIEVDERVRMVK